MDNPFTYQNPRTQEIIRIPATPYGKADSSDKTAFDHETYVTLQLYSPFKAARLHGDGATFDSPDKKGDTWASNRMGAWFAIGDIIFPAGEYQNNASLPHDFRQFDLFTLPKGCIVNVGAASKRFKNRKGGMTQMELVSLNGMSPKLIKLEPENARSSTLIDRWGHA